MELITKFLVIFITIFSLYMIYFYFRNKNKKWGNIPPIEISFLMRIYGNNILKLGIDKVYTELLPDGKVKKVEELIKQKSGTLAFVGDGINDAPVLALSDIGIAMGGLGSDAAIEAADIVIMTDEPSKINKAIKISKKAMRIVKQNIVFAISIKALVLVLSAVGIATMWEAVFADVGVSVIAVLNAIRILKK